MGEKVFDAGTYWGLGWIANTAFGVWMTDKAAQGAWYPAFDKFADTAKDSWPFVTRKLKPESIKEGKKVFDQFRSEILDSSDGLAEKLHDSAVKGAELPLPNIKELNKAEGTRHEKLREIKQGLKKYSQHHKVSHGNMARFIVQNSPGIKTKEEAFEAIGAVEDYLKEGTAKGKARSMGVFLTLMMGGFSVMAPIKFLEDHKEGAVTWLDDVISPEDKRSASEAAAIDARHEVIANEPEQTWTSELSARAIALVPTLAIHFNLGSQANIFSKWGKEFKGFEHYTDKAGVEAGAFLRKKGYTKNIDARHTADIEKLAQENPNQAKHFKHVIKNGEKRTDNILGFTALDLGYAFGMASMTYGASRFTNQWFGNHNKTEPDNEPPISQERPEASPKDKPSNVLNASHENVDTSIIAEGKVAEAEHSTTRV